MEQKHDKWENQAPKRIDLTKQPFSFTANGKEYRVVEELTIGRFEHLDLLEAEFFYGFDMKGLFDRLKEGFEKVNKNKLGDVAVLLHNLMKGVADKVDKRKPVMLRICSLFLITGDEDTTTWSEELANKKIEDWQKEGYSMSDFFTLAANFLPGFMAAYKESTQDILEEAQKEKDNPKEKKKSKS